MSGLSALLDGVMALVVEDHALPNDSDRLQFFEHDSLTTFCADAIRQVVDLFTIGK